MNCNSCLTGLSAVYQPDFCTTQLMVPTQLRRQEIPQSKGWILWGIEGDLFHTFFVYYIIPDEFIHSFDAFSENPQCKIPLNEKACPNVWLVVQVTEVITTKKTCYIMTMFCGENLYLEVNLCMIQPFTTHCTISGILKLFIWGKKVTNCCFKSFFHIPYLTSVLLSDNSHKMTLMCFSFISNFSIC